MSRAVLVVTTVPFDTMGSTTGAAESALGKSSYNSVCGHSPGERW